MIKVKVKRDPDARIKQHFYHFLTSKVKKPGDTATYEQDLEITKLLLWDRSMVAKEHAKYVKLMKITKQIT